ncbi:MAG: OmpA family protein [Planctomycetota bacterium]
MARRTFLARLARPQVLALALGAGTLGGCASQQAYQESLDANRALTSQNAELEAEVRELSSLVDSLRTSGGTASTSVRELRGENERLRGELTEAVDELENIENRLLNLDFGSVDPITSSALERLASAYPDRITYDSQRGMLRFSSDLTFASGSAELRSEARDSLSALADVLNSRQASGYDVMIVGHTDSQNPSANTQRRHPTNMHLSVHRAISVRGELRDLGVPAERIMASGWGEHRPLVPNNPTGGTAGNRRVEIFLVPASDATPTGQRQVQEPVRTTPLDPIK